MIPVKIYEMYKIDKLDGKVRMGKRKDSNFFSDVMDEIVLRGQPFKFRRWGGGGR